MRFNLSEWALRNRTIVLYAILMLGLLGAWSYKHLGQSEDPPFTFKAMVVRTPVRVGAYGQERVSILEGLKESDWVVAAGVHVLLDGQKVRPVDRDNRVVALVGKE